MDHRDLERELAFEIAAARIGSHAGTVRPTTAERRLAQVLVDRGWRKTWNLMTELDELRDLIARNPVPKVGRS